MHKDKLKPILAIQLLHIVGAIVWNVSGVLLVARGLRSPGPTASLALAVLMLVLGTGMIIGLHRWIILYVVASAVALLGALSAVVNAFTADPALWPSDFWRYAGVVLNGIGAAGAILGFIGVFRSRRKK
jgi:hypothetical protein